jgi:DNA polymerase-3 subunit delta
MKYEDAMAMIRKSNLKAVYLITGEERYLADKVEKALLAKLLPEGTQDALQKINGEEDLNQLMGLIESAPFFSEKNVILVRGANLFKEKKNEEKGKSSKTEEKFISILNNMPSYSVIVFETLEKADKRRKLYKTIASCGVVVEVEAVKPWNIGSWLQGKLQELDKELDREAYTYFTEAVGTMQQVSLGFLDKEFDKLALYTTERRITKEDLLQVFSSMPEVSVFAMLDAVSECQVQKALELLHRQLDDAVYLPLTLSLIVRHVRQLWQAKTLETQGYHGRQLAGPMQLNPFIAEKIGRYSRNFSEPVLKKAMLSLAEADYKLKTGQAGAELLEDVIIGLCVGK